MHLLRLFTTLCLGVLAALGASAQREYSPNFSLGAQGGVTLSSMAMSPEIHQKMVQGITMGLRARYHEEKLFGLIGELNITQRGWSEDFARDDAPQFAYSRRLTYIDIPLLTHIYFGPKRVKFIINLGPEVGYLLSDKISANFDYTDIKSVPGFPQGYRNNEQLNKPVENKFDYGITAGGGVEVFINRRNSLLIEGRYYFGLGNIYKATKRDYFAGSRNTTVAVTLGWLFRIR